MTRATVAAIITPDSARRDTILLTKRSVTPFQGWWCIPGGHIEEYEDAVHAVVREVCEETGLVFTDPVFLSYFDEHFPKYRFSAVVLAFFGSAAGTLRLMEQEVEELSWFPLHEALKLPLAFNHQQILQRYAQQLPQ